MILEKERNTPMDGKSETIMLNGKIKILSVFLLIKKLQKEKVYGFIPFLMKLKHRLNIFFL